ncbi:restriction endonuclease subunit S [Stutzerimonas chloritidismutans]|uniref:restriction endonuclease subunit S n=1 Tax=Stutzerimonas chloritidismutans TaxID=203192 RepID=UPI00384D1708
MSFPAYPGYKHSEVELLGEFPDHWTLKRFKNVFGERAERSTDGTEELLSVSAYFGIKPRSETLDEGDHLSRAESLEGYKVCQAGDLVINIMLAWNRGLGFSWQRGIVSPAYCVFYVTDGSVPKFLDYLVRSDECIRYFKTHSAGIMDSRLRLYPESFGRLFTAIPPPCEQTQIARFLDHETARIDALIEEQQRLIELLKEKRHAVISHAVTKGLDPTVPMKDSGVEWLGEVPVHWAIKRLKQLVLDAAGIQMGPFGGMLVDLDDSDTGYKVYGQENTISGDFSSGNRWVPESRYFALSNYHLEVGDIVLTRKGSLGNCRRVSLLPQAGIIDSDTIRVRVQDQMMNPDYLELLLHEAGYISIQLSLVKRGAILSGLNSEIIANLVIVVPPPDGQEELLLEIKAASSKFDQGISDCEYAVGLLRERRSALISAAVTGKIDVRGWQPPARAKAPVLEAEAV